MGGGGNDAASIVVSNLVAGSTGAAAANADKIEAAFATHKTVILPRGVFYWDYIAMPVGYSLIGQGASDAGTVLIHTGAARGIEAYAPIGGLQLQYGGLISDIRFGGNVSSLGCISISDTTAFRVEDCNFEGFTGTNAFCIELRNINQWTENSYLAGNTMAGDSIHYKFTIDDGSNPAHWSFSNTKILRSINTPYLVGERFFVTDPKVNYYASIIEMKITMVIDPASTPTNTKSIFFDLGADSRIDDAKMFLYSEIVSDRKYTRFRLAAGASVAASGFYRTALATGMSELIGSTDPLDELNTTAAFYPGAAGRFCSGSAGGARVGQGEEIYAGKTIATNAVLPIAYLPAGITRLTLRYVGANRIHTMELLCSTHTFAYSTQNSSTVKVVDDTCFNSLPVFNRDNLPYIRFSNPGGNPFLYLDINAINIGGGTLFLTAVIESDINVGDTGDAAFGYTNQKPIVLFPSVAGMTIDALRIEATQPGLVSTRHVTGINLNTTGDVASFLNLPPSCVVERIELSNWSATPSALLTATLRDAATAGGNSLLGSIAGLDGPITSTALTATIASTPLTINAVRKVSTSNIYLNVSAANGTALTADALLTYHPL